MSAVKGLAVEARSSQATGAGAAAGIKPLSVMKLSVIICVRNEKDTILEMIKRVQEATLREGWTKQIIVVDNQSTDGTRELLGTVNDENVHVIYQTENRGKGHSFRAGIALCEGEYTIPQDADLEYHPQDYDALFEKALDERCDVVFGTRAARGRGYHTYRLNEWGIRALTWLTNRLFGTRYTDVATCYKLMRTDLLKSFQLSSNGFDIDFELSAKFAKSHWKIGEVSIGYTPRTYEQGRKMKVWSNGFRALWVLIRERLSS